MAEDQLDDTFEDIFGDDALDDDSLNMDNIDNINNSTNSNSKTNPVEDVDALLSTNFDDIFDTFDDDDAEKSGEGNNMDMLEMDKLLEVEKSKVDNSGTGNTSSIYNDLSEALAEANSFVEEAKNTSINSSATITNSMSSSTYSLPSTPSLAKKVENIDNKNSNNISESPSSFLSPNNDTSNNDNSKGNNWSSMKSEDKDEFLTWLDADEDDNKVDADDEKKSRLKGAGNLSVITATPEVNDTITNAMRAVEKAAANSADESYLDVLRRSTSPRRSLSTGDALALSVKVEAELKKTKPNLQIIRDICRDFGGVPVSVRHQVWSLLLGVSSLASQDIELNSAMHESTVDKVPNYELLQKESLNAAQWATNHSEANVRNNSNSDDVEKNQDNGNDNSNNNDNNNNVNVTTSNNKQICEDIASSIEKLLTFYVRRRGLRNTLDGPVEYVSGLAQVIAPFYAACIREEKSNPKPAILFKCLYALCTAFMPTAHALSTNRNPWEYLAYHQFRVLLKYHDPEIEAHLTKAYPTWDDPFNGLFNPACFFKGYAGLLTCSGLLHLWDYLLVEADPNFCYFLTVGIVMHCREALINCTDENSLNQQVEEAYKTIDTSIGLNNMIRSATKLDANTPKSFRKKMRHIFTTMISSKPKASKNVDWYGKFWDFYMAFNPEKLEDAISLLPKFPGQEAKLARRCEDKYNAPMTGFHLDLKRKFLTVTAEEIVPQVIERSKRFLRYFVIDCRPSNEVSGGRLGQAWILSLNQIRDERKKDETLKSLVGVKDNAHIVIMGSGTDKLLEEISIKEASKYARHDLETMNEIAQFFVDAGFPFISIVDGGFLSCYRVMEQKYTLQEFVDLSPRKCRPLRFDNYVKLKATNPTGAKLLKDHAIFALKAKVKKEEELKNKASINGDPEVEAAIAMAMESAKVGQSLRDKRNKIAMEKTLNSFKEKAGWLNRSVSASMNSMKNALDATIKNSMAQSNNDPEYDDYEDAMKGNNGGNENLVDVPSFNAFSIGGDEDDDDDNPMANSTDGCVDGDSFYAASNDFFGTNDAMSISATEREKITNRRRNSLPIKDSYSEIVPLLSLIQGDVLKMALYIQICQTYVGKKESAKLSLGNDNANNLPPNDVEINLFKCIGANDVNKKYETCLLYDRIVVVETFLRDRETGKLVLNKRRLSGTYTNLQLQAKVASAKAAEQAKIAAEKARRTSKELGRKLSSWFNKSSTASSSISDFGDDNINDVYNNNVSTKSKSDNNKEQVVGKDSLDIEGNKIEKSEKSNKIVEEDSKNEQCGRITWNRHLSGLRRMTIKKGDSNVVTLYFNDDSTCILKFLNREEFTHGLKLALKKMKENI